MSIQITFKHNTHDAMMEHQKKMHDALVGSPAYINSEIALCENPIDLRTDNESCDCE